MIASSLAIEASPLHASTGPTTGRRRIMAVVLPQFLVELATESMRLQTHGKATPSAATRRAVTPSAAAPRTAAPRAAAPRAAAPRAAAPRAAAPRAAAEPHRTALAVVLKSDRQAVSKSVTGWLPGMAEAIVKAELQPKTRIDAVNHRAHQFGIRAGQTIAEARALLTELQICELPAADAREALVRIAESLTKFASVVSFDRAIERPEGDRGGKRSKGNGGKRRPGVVGAGTLWLDVTGIGHLFGGERELAREVVTTVRRLGHRARVAIANGPVLAQAFARWPAHDQTIQVLTDEEVKSAVRWLPITALPVEAETQTWLARLGVLTFADLEKIPRHLTASRLGKEDAAGRVLDLLQGKDDEPLDAFVPRALPNESVHWDEPVTGSEPLSFALRGLVAKVCSRLDGRGLAASRLRLTVTGDRAIARFRATQADWHGDFDLVTPLYRADELFRVMIPRLSSARLSAPSVGLRLEVLELGERQERQLSLVDADLELDGTTPEKMAVLFGGLAAEIGIERFGVLRLVDSHRPERRSALGSVLAAGSSTSGRPRPARRRKRNEPLPAQRVQVESLQGLLPGMEGRPSNDVAFGDESTPPTRLLNPPLEIPDVQSVDAPASGKPEAPSASSPFEIGAPLPIGFQIYTIERADFIHRIDGVEWWSRVPTSRDYYRLWLRHPAGALDVLVFVELSSGKRWVQGFYD